MNVTGRALAATPLVHLGRAIPAPSVVAAIATGLILLTAALDAALRGPWLDEFWTLQLSDTSNGLIALICNSWLRDVHPPLFNASGSGFAGSRCRSARAVRYQAAVERGRSYDYANRGELSLTAKRPDTLFA